MDTAALPFVDMLCSFSPSFWQTACSLAVGFITCVTFIYCVAKKE